MERLPESLASRSSMAAYMTFYLIRARYTITFTMSQSKRCRLTICFQDGKPELVQAASVSIHGPHGQYVENIHLQPYESERQFWEELYEKHYSKLFEKAMSFVKDTTSQAVTDDVLVFIR